MESRYLGNLVIVGTMVLAITLVAVAADIGIKMSRSQMHEMIRICEMQAEHSRMQRQAISFEKCMKHNEKMMPTKR